jgi:hypothetical protein
MHTRKMGLGIGVKWGRGWLLMRTGLDPPKWSAPVFYKVKEGSFGFTAGKFSSSTLKRRQPVHPPSPKSRVVYQRVPYMGVPVLTFDYMGCMKTFPTTGKAEGCFFHFVKRCSTPLGQTKTRSHFSPYHSVHAVVYMLFAAILIARVHHDDRLYTCCNVIWHIHLHEL